MPQTLLSHLTSRFSSHPENIATEALAFILGRSRDTRRALSEIAGQVGYACATELRYVTQVTHEDGGRPDIVGSTVDGRAHIVVEAKFWAGLTGAQPTGYLNSLPSDGALLLFVAPSMRTELLWSELQRRVSRESLDLGKTSVLANDLRCATVGNHVLALVSWRILLQRMSSAAIDAGDTSAEADIRQLAALCDAQDSAAFLPLESEELNPQIGKRVIEYGKIVDDLADRLVTGGTADARGTRSSGGNGWYSRPFRMKGHGCYLLFSAWAWMKWGDSPLWLSIKDAEWKRQSPDVRDALLKAQIRAYDGAQEGDGWMVSIDLLLRAERNAVFDAALRQLYDVVEALPNAGYPQLQSDTPFS